MMLLTRSSKGYSGASSCVSDLPGRIPDVHTRAVEVIGRCQVVGREGSHSSVRK